MIYWFICSDIVWSLTIENQHNPVTGCCVGRALMGTRGAFSVQVLGDPGWDRVLLLLINALPQFPGQNTHTHTYTGKSSLHMLENHMGENSVVIIMSKT